jgi:integrase
MEYFAGLDVSMEETHVIIVNRDGKVILETRTPTAPKTIAAALAKGPAVERVLFETGRMAPIALSIAEIEPPELLAVLRNVEKRGALEIAKRLHQTVGQIFRYGIVTGRANRDPSVDLKGALKASGWQAHHHAMPRENLPEFLQALASYDGEARTRLALRLAVLTFVRTTELRAARWDEVDLEAAEWRIPAIRAAYNHAQYLPERRRMMQQWADCLDDLAEDGKAIVHRFCTRRSNSRPRSGGILRLRGGVKPGHFRS